MIYNKNNDFFHFWLLYFKVHLWCKTFQSFYKHVHVHILIQIFMRKRSNKWNPKSAATLGLCRTIVSCNAGSTSCLSLTIFSRRAMLLSLNLTIILLLCKHLSFLLHMSWSCSIFSCKIWKCSYLFYSRWNTGWNKLFGLLMYFVLVYGQYMEQL